MAGVLKIGGNTIINLCSVGVIELAPDGILRIVMNNGNVYQFGMMEDAGLTPEHLLEQIFHASTTNEGLRLDSLVSHPFLPARDLALRTEIATNEVFNINAIGVGSNQHELPSLEEVRRLAVEKVEKLYLTEALTQKKGRIDATADLAGISPRQLNNLMTKYELKKEDFKQGDQFLWKDYPD